MARPSARISFIQAVLGLAVLAVLGRSAQLQLVEGDEWAKKGERNRTVRVTLPAARGTIFDRAYDRLAVTQVSYRVSLAPEQIRDSLATARQVARALGADAKAIMRDLRAGKRSIYFHGPFTALQVQGIRRLRGVALTPFHRRSYPASEFAWPTVGALTEDGRSGASGIERMLDSVLTGRDGEAIRLKDTRNRRFESPGRADRPPVPGNDVVLTLDAGLQEIAERALDDALDELKASSGDVVFLDPWSGELLAVASRLPDETSTMSAFGDVFEPGSTAKLFTAAALLSHGLVDSDDVVGGENGRWLKLRRDGGTYPITDDHPSRAPLTLAHSIEVSSNIGMAKFAERLTAEQHYDALRDFGFGAATGVEYPAESRGILPTPDGWKPDYERQSIARGYRISVTAVQLAAAYGAIANGGVLYRPTLVREIRAPDGTILYHHRPEPVRRVITEDVARTLQDYLRRAADTGGTGSRAQIQGFRLVGKTGTARRVINGAYAPGKYASSFAAIWPAADPQLVVIVKINDPVGGFFGGLTAAPLTRTMLQDALASRSRALKMSRLAPGASAAATPPPLPDETDASAPVVAVAWPVKARDSAVRPVPIPDVAGRELRAAAAALHGRGFRVAIRGEGSAVRTEPEAGTPAVPGATVTVVAAAHRERAP